jgi:hypothetical protein
MNERISLFDLIYLPFELYLHNHHTLLASSSSSSSEKQKAADFSKLWFLKKKAWTFIHAN